VSASVDDHRPAELVASLAAVRTQLSNAATAAARDAWSITLIAVTKSFPASDMAILLGLGVADLGENRDQEARAKLAQLGAADRFGSRQGAPTLPRLHFIGRLQTNKCRAVAQYAFCVHTVDRPSIVTALAEGVRAAEREPLPVFAQVSLDGDPARGGVVEAALPALADQITSDDGLRLLGVMAVAPLDQSADEAFARLSDVSVSLREQHPYAVGISAGMSGDFELAVKYGATHVRIGSALLGRREATFS
jgi:pyridoxal phosphate enzyme (YggS family)